MDQANTVLLDDEEVMSNVITFPKSFIQDDMPATVDEARERIDEAHTYYAEAVADEAFEAVMQIFNNYSYFIRHDQTNMKDMVAIAEVMKAVLLRYHHIQHPMQIVIDKAISVEGETTEES